MADNSKSLHHLCQHPDLLKITEDIDPKEITLVNPQKPCNRHVIEANSAKITKNYYYLTRTRPTHCAKKLAYCPAAFN
ncbi:hypothetical protein [Colwellia hornerae]|uniref:Uncharacterized protein n=1 Tax=Colwellia hornerae TaxID=89402 RepID=A0A5C6Q4M8_9GAMM|nr:hypothetical protein [Colwellia hornerae]TWX48075.1 hypothetical protein ESZ28_17180 [Colwellia hornerae]TWX54894.1 hypothetical protein ESZ26_17150 [Colwellia hornerae]TWX63752.1 hypothetical protein ESZ27_15945 [Colwellia hornerae]